MNTKDLLTLYHLIKPQANSYWQTQNHATVYVVGLDADSTNTYIIKTITQEYYKVHISEFVHQCFTKETLQTAIPISVSKTTSFGYVMRNMENCVVTYDPEISMFRSTHPNLYHNEYGYGFIYSKKDKFVVTNSNYDIITIQNFSDVYNVIKENGEKCYVG